MDKKKIIKICLIFILPFFVLALIETGIRALIGLSGKISQREEEKKQEQAEYNSDKQITQRQITTFIEDIVDAIGDKDYNYVFDSLDEAYREYKFNNEVNKLKEYMEEKINIGTKHEIIRINQNGGMYQVLLGITNGNLYSSQSFTVKVQGINECTFMFDEYTNFNKMNETAKYTDVQYQLSYYYETPEAMGYIIDIEDLTAENIKIDFDESSKLVLTNGKTYKCGTISSIEIKPNESNRIEIVFPKQYIGKSYLQLNVTENDVPREIIISLERDIM
ncbi:MAG: hypothetical protein IJ220_08365 [Clostridia bacterium]|nr:hypothetical protein [Clostridia bacterium]